MQVEEELAARDPDQLAAALARVRSSDHNCGMLFLPGEKVRLRWTKFRKSVMSSSKTVIYVFLGICFHTYSIIFYRQVVMIVSFCFTYFSIPPKSLLAGQAELLDFRPSGRWRSETLGRRRAQPSPAFLWSSPGRDFRNTAFAFLLQFRHSPGEPVTPSFDSE